MQIPGMLHESQRIGFAGLPAMEATGTGARAEENRALFHAGLSRNIYCVSIDAVIAASQPGMLWKPLAASQAGDRLNRGRNMDTRAAALACRFVA
ncbi:hypothetical protein LMG23992_01034 [Cupriavidus laharis]|uniref:Uncharacterized protein n=1 Tax=Cupriavidus laharis TaxID=151654 RepID=A0ABM8WLA1_9BURK|nr:hypothetical protein [Cupriavidus laharis]CAG9168148.1 hypothetical protein LMG23992_01034 [Cupriavidus laharis]